MDSNLGLIAELPARLGGSLAYDAIYADPPWLKARFIPSFPECNPEISETSIVFDLLELFRSAQRPGGYFLLNCTCGYALDADIKDLVFVSHPDANTVIWELDVHGLGPALEHYWAWHNGFLRLIFKREEYEADLCAMLRALRAAGSPDLPVDELEPNRWGEAYERAMALREDDLCLREPVLPAGTALEFGLSGSDLLVIDGKPDGGWPERLFTRWFAHAAFKQWISYVGRGFWVRHELAENNSGVDLTWFNEPQQRNNFFLLREAERTDCDEAGAVLVRCLKACLQKAQRPQALMSVIKRARARRFFRKPGNINPWKVGASLFWVEFSEGSGYENPCGRAVEILGFYSLGRTFADEWRDCRPPARSRSESRLDVATLIPNP